jgi:hypothetical protein
MTAEDEMPDRLGPYHLLERIGEGGMGVVFMARDAGGRTVALKILRSVVAGDPTARHRLAREVETMRRVRSPYVAEVIDADLAGDVPYIVTRYVPGRTLDQVVNEGGPLPPPALLRLACGLADALAAVHAAGVVHRDLKPGNVMLQGELPVVIDFGIAQGPDATRLTMTGMFMGTPGYLAPEVIEGHPSSEASDIHAWGATVAFAATGHPPYGSGAYEAVFYRIVNGQPDLAGVPAPLLPLLTAALARDPGFRPPAVQLGALAAVMDPNAIAAGVVLAGEAAAGFTAFPATSTDVARGAALLAGNGLAGAPGVALGRPSPGAGPAAAGGPGVAGAGLAPPGVAPVKAGRPSPADFADVLPPVQYRPGSQPARPPRRRDRRPVPEPARPPPDNPFAPRSAPARRTASPRWPSAMVIAAMVIVASLSVIFPVAGTAGAMALIVVLRAGELTRQRAVLRRSARGARPSDPVLLAAAFPWYLARSVLACLLLAPFALAAAVLAGGITIVVVPAHQLPRAVAVAAGTMVAFYGLGPGSARPRRQFSRLFAAAASTRIAQAVALTGMTALALATLTAAASWPSLYWPTGPPGGFWHFGVAHVGLGHAGVVGRFLLARLHSP